MTFLLLVVLSLFLSNVVNGLFVNPYTFNSNSLSKFNDFVKVPYPKELVQTGGRLIERHLGYLYEAGFNSVLSIVVFATNDTVYNDMTGSFPSSDYEMSILASYGLSGRYLPSSLTVESANEISKIIDEMPKPLYLHCHVGASTTTFFSP